MTAFTRSSRFAARSVEVYDFRVADELFSVLTRFHREVVLPDIERVVDERLDARITPLRQEMRSNFDAIHRRPDRLAEIEADL